MDMDKRSFGKQTLHRPLSCRSKVDFQTEFFIKK